MTAAREVATPLGPAWVLTDGPDGPATGTLVLGGGAGGGVEAPDLLPHAAAEEDRGLREECVTPEIREAERRVEIELQVAVGPQHQQVAEDEARGGVRLERVDGGLHRPGKVRVVSIEVGEDFGSALFAGEVVMAGFDVAKQGVEGR